MEGTSALRLAAGFCLIPVTREEDEDDQNGALGLQISIDMELAAETAKLNA